MAADPNYYGESAQKDRARKLSDDELIRHARVSIDNRHRCRECFTCACVAVSRERWPHSLFHRYSPIDGM